MFRAGSGSENCTYLLDPLPNVGQHSFSKQRKDKGHGSSYKKDDQEGKGDDGGPFERASKAILGRGIEQYWMEYDRGNLLSLRWERIFLLAGENGRFGTPLLEWPPSEATSPNTDVSEAISSGFHTRMDFPHLRQRTTIPRDPLNIVTFRRYLARHFSQRIFIPAIP